MTSDRFRDAEEQTAILGRIASAYAAGAPEESALRLAAFALLFAVAHHPDEFEEFLRPQELTTEQRAHLKRLGLEE